MIPENIIDKIPQALIPAIYTLIIAGIVEKMQGQKIKEFLANNGQKASNWQAAGYGFFGLVIITGFLFIIIFVLPTKGYEKSINIDKNVVLHYSKVIDEAKSQKLAHAIRQSGFMKGSEGADLFFGNEANNFSLKFVLPDTSVLSDTLVVSDFNGFENYINYNLRFEKRIEIGFTDINLLKDYELIDMDHSNPQIYEPLLYLQPYRINENHTIFFNNSMPIDEVKIVENAIKKLQAYFPINQRIDIVFLNNGNDYTIKFFVIKDLWQTPAIIDRLKSTIEYIKDNGIDKSLKLVLVDNQTFEEKQI